jgi:hypothetical protein
MKTALGHLTYCTNIHAGKNWIEDFDILQRNLPIIKKSIAPDQPFGIGLRVSEAASLQLINPVALTEFKQWLKDNNAYVFTMNGFPYGDFHHTVVKENVHCPDWTTITRKAYTIRLFKILQALLPPNMDGGISTSPLTYRHWFTSMGDAARAKDKATLNIIEVLKELHTIYVESELLMHLDVEPEPDGMLETGKEYITWFEDDLLRLGVPAFMESFGLSVVAADESIKRHLCLCYDVCHFSIGYEDHETVLKELHEKGLRVGKIQISAALKANLDIAAEGRVQIKESFGKFNETTYLHQVVAKKSDGSLIRYPDLPQALDDFDQDGVEQWRAHFHVPISLNEIGFLESTQDDILKVLQLQKKQPFTHHLEVETYTWEVLPEKIKLPVTQSIIDELNWVIKAI